MKKHIVSLLAAVALVSGTAFADETYPEKAKETANDAKRQGRKGANRVDETLCTGTKAECAKGKAKNRANESKDTVKDGADELKDKVD